MTKGLVFRAKVLVLFLILCSTVRAADFVESAWRQFREQFAYHIQAIALVDQRYLIITEPPPGVTLDGVTAVDPLTLGNCQAFKHKMGFDGWLKDIACELPVTMTPRRRTDLLDSLHLYVFGTTYKAENLELTSSQLSSATPPSPLRLDLRVTAADLYRWTFTENEQFARAGRSFAATPGEILRGSETGIFYSRKPGLVLWVLPRTLDMAKRRREARQFALDSDLILGAFQGATQFAIVARERILPATVLPPLRFETIELLASLRRKNLEQSYERMYVLAGRIDDERHDWAPIYLSPELIDTEYGSLLNMTDQMLKSWTEAGRVRYINFGYPDPPTGFPFGKTGLADTESAVTYNWNTVGVGYKATFGAYPVFALNRTGALAVSYIAGEDQRLAAKEEHAYRYFAQLNNPDLARVVQYAALYQIFRDMKIQNLTGPPLEPENPATEAMKDLTLETLDMIRDEDLASRIDFSVPGSARFMAELTACRKTLASITLRYQEAGIEDLARQFSEFRNDGKRSPLLRLLRNEVLPTEVVGEAVGSCGSFVPDVVGKSRRAKAFNAYRKAWARPETGWVRTASVVVSSWTIMPVGHNFVGGHNLYSRITELREDATLPAGKVSVEEVAGKVVIVYSRYDRAKAHDLVRVAAREAESGTPRLSLRATLEEELMRATPVRASRVEALGYPQFESGQRSFQQTLYSNGAVPRGEADGGARFNSQTVAANFQEVTANPGHVVVVKNADGTYQLVFGGLENPMEVKSMPALVDQILDPANLSAGPSEMQLHLAGFTPEEGSAFLKNVEFQMKRQANDDFVLTGVIEKNGRVSPEVAKQLNTQYDFSRATLSEPRISVIEEGPLRGGHLFEVDLKVPARNVLQKSLWMTIRIFFSETLPNAVSASIRNSLDTILARLGNKRAALKTHTKELKKEILRICPDAKRVEQELNDFKITEEREGPLGSQPWATSAQAA